MINTGEYKIGQEVHVSNHGDYYSGDGIIKAISNWDNVGVMIAVYFQGKGTLWFEPSEINR